jgi:hypothetical protein
MVGGKIVSKVLFVVRFHFHFQKKWKWKNGNGKEFDEKYAKKMVKKTDTRYK